MTNVKDSDDVFYRQCNNQGRINRHWKEYNLAIAAKNSADDKQVMQITDIDINSLQIAQVGPNFDNFPTAEELMTERSTFLLKRHTAYNYGQEESAFDVSRIFELNLAHELATEQKKNMKFIDKEDQIEDLLYKHHELLHRVENNFQRFNEQLEREIHTEEQFEHNAMTGQSIADAHHELERLYEGATELKENLAGLLEETRTTLERIFE